MNRLRIIGLAVVVLLLVVVIFQNTQEATVSLLVVKVTMPLAMLLALILAGGFVSGLAAALILGRKGVPPAKT